MQLSDLGQLANDYWLEIENKFPLAVLDHFVVMPNHVHGIINIENPLQNCRDAIYRASKNVSINPNPTNPDAINRVSTGGVTGSKNPMLHENLSRFVHWYKGRCTFEMRKIHPKFAWQPRFHEHVIRNEESYLQIVAYIQTNPLKWQEDKYYS